MTDDPATDQPGTHPTATGPHETDQPIVYEFAAGQSPANPPPLVSPVDKYAVQAVLDQDGTLTAGLAVGADGEHAVLLVGSERLNPGQAEELARWTEALTEAARVARIARIAGHGRTIDGRGYLITCVRPSLADHLRLMGQPAPDQVRHIGARIADALATAHSYGIVHGAVSPSTILMDTEGVLLGGFGATAPCLSAPLGLWAMTPPEHRSAALAGEYAASVAGDVFGLAATMCVALAGALPWADPAGWADAAGLPRGSSMVPWVEAVRDALSPDPDQRPGAEEFAATLRMPADVNLTEFHGTRVDLRHLIPRQVRRLSAHSIAAMADDEMPATGRAVVPSHTASPSPATARGVRGTT